MLVNDGNARGGSFALAPYRPVRPDYAVQAEIQRIDNNSGAGFMLVARREQNSGYRAGFHYNRAWIIAGDPVPSPEVGGSKDFNPGQAYHSYRLEVKGNTLKLFIDDALWIEGNDNKYLTGTQAGLWVYGGAQVNIRNFKLIAV
jgi:hypothetical protein